MIIIMILMMILHMNINNILLLIEMLSFLIMCSFISYVSEVFVIPEFDV